MRRIVIAIMFGTSFLAAVSAEPVSGKDGKTASALEDRVSEWVRLELEDAREKNAWSEQNARLDALAALRRSEKKQFETTLSNAEKRVREAQKIRGEKTRANASAATNLVYAADVATQTGHQLLSVYDGLPEPLRERLASGARFLRDRLKTPASSEDASERLRIVAAFGYDLQHLLSDVHVGKQLVQLKSGKRVEADVLYLGGATGYYLAPDRRQAGLLIRSDKGWTTEPRDALAEQVALALRVKRKETPPMLVRLPLPAPTALKEAQP